MERKWILGISLAVLIVAFSIILLLQIGSKPMQGPGNTTDLSNQTGDIAGSLSYQIDLNSPMPVNPDKILVYKANPPVVNKETTLALAKKFNVTGTLRGDCVIESDDLVYGIEILKISGRVRYSNSNRPNDAMDAPDKLPSDREAESIATRFLQEQDLFPEGAYFTGTERYFVKSTDKNGSEVRHNGRIEVGFGRMLNNLKVLGSGIGVTIGGNGDVIEYSSNWRDYVPYKEYPLISSETAFAELKEKGIATGVKKPDKVTINNVYLAYASKAPAFKEEYLEPVWVFKGKAMSNDSKDKPVTEYIPALTDDARKELSFS